jgi:hypothetical protein
MLSKRMFTESSAFLMFFRVFPWPILLLAVTLLELPSGVAQDNGAPLPPGVPVTTACEPHDAPTFASLRVFNGTALVPLVSACGQGRPPGACYTQYLSLTKPDEYQGDLVAPSATQGGWSCAMVGGWSGWVPNDRLAPVPATPAITTKQWLGTWVNTHMGASRDRLILTRSPAGHGIVRVDGSAFYTNVAHNVNYGEMGGDALAMGPFLHIVDQTVQTGCVLDLMYNPTNGTFRAVDNKQCGGFNVSFNGVWRRLAPGK